MDDRLRSGGDDDEVAVPGRELLQRREQLLALGPRWTRRKPLLGLARRELDALELALRPLLGRLADGTGALEQDRRGVCRSRSGSAYGARATRRSSSRRTFDSGSSKRSTRSSRPPAARASARASFSESPGARSASSSRMTRPGSRRNGTSWQRERIVGAIGPSSSATRTITAYEQLLEILQQRVGRVVVQQVRVRDHVDAALGLVRAHVQIAVERADLVDPDHLAERLEREEIRMHARLDAALVAEQGGGEGRVRARLPTPAGPWKRGRRALGLP